MNLLKNFKNNFSFKEASSCLAIIIIVFILDRSSKISIIKQQTINDGSIFFNNFLNFDLVWNTGIGFGLFSQNADMYYHLITFLISLVVIFLIYLISKADFLEKTLLSMILGGALGNFYDRVFYFAVPDFIDVHINNFHWFTFNIADIFITIGIIFLISKDLILNKR
tara:strand:- start:1039 stop:1539 length:501 start_codon:yes stop_codon:yes gene_type:complete